MDISHLSVIIIDKHPLMRMALSATLASAENVDVIAEYTGVNELLENFGKFLPNMILLGIGNPGEDELSTILHLRKFFPLAQVLVLVTGELQGQKEVALQHGAHAVWEKTISREALLRGLEMQFKNHLFNQEKKMFNFNRKQKGQGLVEYALILVLVAVIVIVVLQVLGPLVGSVFTEINSGLTVSSVGGGSSETPTEVPTDVTFNCSASGWVDVKNPTGQNGASFSCTANAPYTYTVSGFASGTTIEFRNMYPPYNTLAFYTVP